MDMDRRIWTAGLFRMICGAIRLHFSSHSNVVKLFTHSKHTTERRKATLHMWIIFLSNLFEDRKWLIRNI